MNFLLAPLKFFNLLDRGNKLSITNTAVVVIVVKMALAPFDWATAAALLVSLLNYMDKRRTSAKAEAIATLPAIDNEEITAMKTKLEEVESKVSSIAIQAGLRPIVKK